MDCMHWVNRDSYLPQGSRGLKVRIALVARRARYLTQHSLCGQALEPCACKRSARMTHWVCLCQRSTNVYALPQGTV